MISCSVILNNVSQNLRRHTDPQENILLPHSLSLTGVTSCRHVVHLVSKMTTHEKDVMRSSEFYRRSEAWLDTFEAQSHDLPVVLQLDKLQHENIGMLEVGFGMLEGGFGMLDGGVWYVGWGGLVCWRWGLVCWSIGGGVWYVGGGVWYVGGGVWYVGGGVWYVGWGDLVCWRWGCRNLTV